MRLTGAAWDETTVLARASESGMRLAAPWAPRWGSMLGGAMEFGWAAHLARDLGGTKACEMVRRTVPGSAQRKAWTTAPESGIRLVAPWAPRWGSLSGGAKEQGWAAHLATDLGGAKVHGTVQTTVPGWAQSKALVKALASAGSLAGSLDSGMGLPSGRATGPETAVDSAAAKAAKSVRAMASAKGGMSVALTAEVLASQWG